VAERLLDQRSVQPAVQRHLRPRRHAEVSILFLSTGQPALWLAADSQAGAVRRRGAVAILNLADPEQWIMEQYLPDVGGRTLGGKGHADIVRCSHLDLRVSQNNVGA